MGFPFCPVGRPLLSLISVFYILWGFCLSTSVSSPFCWNHMLAVCWFFLCVALLFTLICVCHKVVCNSGVTFSFSQFRALGRETYKATNVQFPFLSVRSDAAGTQFVGIGLCLWQDGEWRGMECNNNFVYLTRNIPKAPHVQKLLLPAIPVR